MTTLYIAGPMSGLPEFNYPAFNAAEAQLKAAGYNVLNPVASEQHNPTPGTPQSWDWYMRHAIRMVLEADGVALLLRWHKSKGASLEYQIARSLELPCYPAFVWFAEGTARLKAPKVDPR